VIAEPANDGDGGPSAERPEGGLAAGRERRVLYDDAQWHSRKELEGRCGKEIRRTRGGSEDHPTRAGIDLEDNELVRNAG